MRLLKNIQFSLFRLQQEQSAKQTRKVSTKPVGKPETEIQNLWPVLLSGLK